MNKLNMILLSLFSATLMAAPGNDRVVTASAIKNGAYTMTLPTADGTAAQCLKTSGVGVWSFGDCVSGSWWTTPLANNTQLNARNAANDANINLIKAETNNTITIGNFAKNAFSFSPPQAVSNYISIFSDSGEIFIESDKADSAGTAPIQFYADGIDVFPSHNSTSTNFRFWDKDINTYVGVKAPTTGDNTTYILPAADGNSGDCMKTDGSGLLSFASCGGGGADLIFDTGSNATVKTKNVTGVDSKALILDTGTTDGAPGNLVLRSGGHNGLTLLGSSNELDPETAVGFNLGGDTPFYYLGLEVMGLVQENSPFQNTMIVSGEPVTTPSGVSAVANIRVAMQPGEPNFPASNNLGIFTSSSAAADANPTASLIFDTGNKTAGTGNSGGVKFTIGTSSGGSQGSFKFLKSGVAPSVGDVWTASNADGTGYWAAPSGGGGDIVADSIGIGGSPPATKDFAIITAEPTLFWSETDAAANNKGFQFLQSGQVLYMQFTNDAGAGNSILEVTRSGNTVTGVTWPQGNFTVNGHAQFNGNPTYFGTADATVVSNAAPDFLFNTPTANHTTAIFTGPATSDDGALAFITVANGDFYVQSVASNDGTGSTAHPLMLNPQGGRLVLGSAAGLVELKGYGDGDLSVASEVIVSSSDQRLKDKQADYAGGLDVISKITPVMFKWKKDLPQGANGRTHVGFFAQNVEEAIPEAVSSGKDGMKSLDDRAIIAALVNANKELLKRVEALEAQLQH